MGVTHRASVTVIAPDAATADALASALSVLGPEAGFDLLTSFPGTSALMEFKTEDGGRCVWTDGFPMPPPTLSEIEIPGSGPIQKPALLDSTIAVPPESNRIPSRP